MAISNFSTILLTVLPLPILALLIPPFFLICMLITAIKLHYSGLHTLPRPHLSLRTFLLHGDSIFARIFRHDPNKTATFLLSTAVTLRSSVFRLCGPCGIFPNVFITSPEALRAVAVAEQDAFVKPDLARRFLNSYTGSGSIFVAEGDVHRRLRAVVSPAFRHENLMRLSETFLSEGDALADRLADTATGSIDPLLAIRHSTFRMIIITCFGASIVSEKTVDELLALYHTALTTTPSVTLAIILFRAVIPFVPQRYLGTHERAKVELRHRVRKLVKSLLEVHSQPTLREGDDDGGDRSVFLLSVMCAACEKQRMSEEELEQMVLSFLLAGQATTTVAVAWTLYLLAGHPEWQTRLQEEISKRWRRSEGLEALDKLPLLHDIVRESIRLRPPLAYTLRQTTRPITLPATPPKANNSATVKAKPDTNTKEYVTATLPAGTTIRIPLLALQVAHPAWGDDATSFNPGRYACMSERQREETRWLWCDFWFGRHACVGQRFALLETKALVAQIVGRYCVSVDEGRDGMPVWSGTDTTPKGLRLHLTRRQTDG